MLKVLLKKIIGKAYVFLRNIGETYHAEQQFAREKSKIQIGVESKLDSDCIIQNNSGNSKKIQIGNFSWIKGYLLVYNDEGQIIIGDNSFVGTGTRIWSAKRIMIGDNVLISHNVNIHDNNSHPLNSIERRNHFHIIRSKNILPDGFELNAKEIVIENDVWIGFNVTILKGVIIGKGSIIGSNSIITKDIPPYSLVIPGHSSIIIKNTH